MEGKTGITISGKDAIFYLIFLVGAIGHLSENTRPIMAALTPYILFSMGTYVLLHTFRSSRYSLFLWVGGTYIGTFSLEVIGVNTGYLFGRYAYGEPLGFSLFGVPLVVAYNWVFVILGAANIAHRFARSRWFFCSLSATLAVIFDVALEPLAVSLEYWIWKDDIIPFQNYLAWFLISVTASYALRRFNINYRSPTAIHYFISQCMFFIIVILFI